MQGLSRPLAAALCLAAGSGVLGCGPRAHIPPRPTADLFAPARAGTAGMTAQRLAPTLYLQRDESFPLTRVVAVLHPTRPIVAYHLLWRDDVHGAWLPFTVPTDQEVVWVGFDTTTMEPTDLWTYWHGRVLHADWRGRGPAAIDVQWGKHGSLPRRVNEDDLPAPQTLNVFYAFTWIGIPDMLLGRLNRKGPVCFCRGYRRYRQFTRPLPLADRLDAVVRTEDPREVLRAVFGERYSRKDPWP